MTATSSAADKRGGGPPADPAIAPAWRRRLARYEWLPVLLILLAGLVERILWVSRQGRLKPFPDEMQQVAVCFAKTGVLGDAYFVGQGPTAHVGPVMPLIGGVIYRTFGVGSLTSEILLTALALAFFGIALMAFYAAFRRLGTPMAWRLLALAAAVLTPLNFKLEVQSLRLFEGALAVALLACSLLLVVRLDSRARLRERDSRARLRERDYVVPALLGGFLTLVNPPAALGAYGAFGILTLKKVSLRHWPGVFLVMAAGLALFIAPWAIRNEHVFGRLILTRSNFPLEHAIGFHPAAVAPSDPRVVFVDRIRAIHPYSGETVSAARTAFAKVGELAYMDRLKADTQAWERAHPADAARIAARHFMEFWLPPKWSWRIYTDRAPLVPARQALIWATTFAAVAAVAWRLMKAPLGPGLYLACLLIIPSLPYALVQPVQRYRYLVFVLTFFLAADFLGLVGTAAARSRRPAAK